MSPCSACLLPQPASKGDIFIESNRGHSQRVATLGFSRLFSWKESRARGRVRSSFSLNVKPETGNEKLHPPHPAAKSATLSGNDARCIVPPRGNFSRAR